MELSKVTLEIFSKLEQKWLYHHHCDGKKTRVLCIDGGGNTGIVAGAALLHLEDQIKASTGDSNARIADYFDVVAGTGIGALLAAMLVADDGSGRPLFSTRDAVVFMEENQSQLYKTKRVGLLRKKTSRCSGKSMEAVLKKAFTRHHDNKVLTLRDTCKPLLIPCFDLRTSAPFVFSRADASESPSFDFELWKVVRATSADPSLFDSPFELASCDGKTRCSSVDGGLVMNNPTAAAVTHVLHNKRDFQNVNGTDDLMVLSLGNGVSLTSEEEKKKNVKGRGRRRCEFLTAVGIVMDGVSETVDQMVGNAFCWNPNDYVRIQANGVLERADQVLSHKGVESVPPFGGKRLLTETNGQRIESFVQRLVVVSGRSSLPPSPCKETAMAAVSSPLVETAVSPLVNGR